MVAVAAVVAMAIVLLLLLLLLLGEEVVEEEEEEEEEGNTTGLPWGGIPLARAAGAAGAAEAVSIGLKPPRRGTPRVAPKYPAGVTYGFVTWAWCQPPPAAATAWEAPTCVTVGQEQEQTMRPCHYV